MRTPRQKTGEALDAVLGLALDWTARKPAPGLPRRLDALFRELARPDPSRSPDEIEELIWALWISHPDRDIESRMALAVDAMAAGDLDAARPILDGLVEERPDWAEAWNKRATLAFLQGRDADALADIARTLALEPRHFGALAGFGQICLKAGRLTEARAAFQVALAINPHLQGLGDLLDELRPDPTTLH